MPPTCVWVCKREAPGHAGGECNRATKCSPSHGLRFNSVRVRSATFYDRDPTRYCACFNGPESEVTSRRTAVVLRRPSRYKALQPGSSANELLIIKFRAARRFDAGVPEVTDLAGTKYRQLCRQLLDFSDGHVEGVLVFDVPIGRQVNKLSLIGQEFDISKLVALTT